MPSLSDRLKSFGVIAGPRDLSQPHSRSGIPIEQVIDGQFQETPYGQAFVVETRYPAGYQQGSAGLRSPDSLRRIAHWAGDQRLLDFDPRGFIYLDTETTGLAGGTGTYAFLIGIGRFDENGFHIAQYFMRDPVEELAQLAAVNNFLGPCSGLVTFNGKAFDIPLLNARYITNGAACPLNTAAHVDLLPLARRLWRDRLPSRALGFLEEHILGARRSQEDVPGWLIPSLYFDYLRFRDATPLRGIFYHNAMDILSMAALLNHMAGLLENPLNGEPVHGIDLISVAKLLEDLNQYEAAAQCYEAGLACDLPAETRQAAAQRWSFMEKRRENYPLAVEIWRQAAARGEVYAFVELAKYFEHRARNYIEAYHWTQAALALVNAPGFPRLERRQWNLELGHRMERLQRKTQVTR